MKTLKSILKKKMKDPEFCKAYEQYEKDFQISQEIIKLRTKAGLTQSELAKKAHTSQSAIARLESGQHKNLTLAFLGRIGAALGAAPEIHFKRIHSLKA